MYLCDKYAPELIGSTIEERARCYQLLSVLDGYFWGKFKIIFAESDRSKCLDNMFEGNALADIVKYLGRKRFLLGYEFRFVDLYLFEIINFINAIDVNGNRLFSTYPALNAFF